MTLNLQQSVTLLSMGPLLVKYKAYFLIAFHECVGMSFAAKILNGFNCHFALNY